MRGSSVRLAEKHQEAGHSFGIGRLKEIVNALLPPFVRDLKLTRYYLKYGEAELQLVPLLCSPTRDALDVGANEGMYVHLMRHHARHVMAFEPVESLHAKLARRYRSGVTVERLALSDHTGTATLRIPMVGEHSVAGLSSLADVAQQVYGDCREVTIRTARLDDIYEGDAGFIKIDVEGHERAVLDGAWNTISTRRPNLLIETEEHLTPDGLRTITQKLHSLGYAGHFVRHGTLQPVERFDATRWQNPESLSGYGPGLSRQAFPDFINNFIFIQADDERLRSDMAARLRQAGA